MLCSSVLHSYSVLMSILYPPLTQLLFKSSEVFQLTLAGAGPVHLI